MLGFYGLSENAKRINEARAVLDYVNAREMEDRATSRRKQMGEEQAGRVGFITIDQSEAQFIELNVYAYDNLGESFVATERIGFGQQAVYKTRIQYPVRVRLGHIAGTPAGHQYASKMNMVTVPTFDYSSDIVRTPRLATTQFKLEDFDERVNSLEQLAHSLRKTRQRYTINMVLDAPLEQDLTTSITNYFNSIPFNGRLPWVPEAEIVPNVLVSTNILDASAEGGLTKSVFKQRATYENRTGLDFPSMFCSMAGAPWEATWDQATVIAYNPAYGNASPSKAIPAAKWDEAINMSFRKGGAYMNWFGRNVFVQPLNIIPQGYTISPSSEPSAYLWDKYNEARSEEQPIFGSRMENQRMEIRSIGLAKPDVCAPNFILQKISS